MYPIALDMQKTIILLIGKGAAFDRRKAQLLEAGAWHLICREQLEAEDLRTAAVIMVAGLTYEEAKTIAQAARAAGKLVNVEDVSELCDFYYTAHIRRGDLLIAVSTGGASPTLAKRVRDRIALLFDESWDNRTEMMKQLRDQLRAAGKNMKEVAAECEKFLEAKGWLKP